MNYAYFQGQEAQALAYYKKLLEVEPDPQARLQIADLVAKLQKIIEEKQSSLSKAETIQNAVPA